MYPTSSAYQKAVCASVRTDRVTGALTLTDGTVLTLTDADIVSGSLCMDNQCVNGEELTFGCAYLGQVSLQLRTDLSPCFCPIHRGKPCRWASLPWPRPSAARGLSA